MLNPYARTYGSATTTSLNASVGNAVWVIISLILAVVGGLLIYFLFLNKKNEGKFKGFLGWMYEFLSFKKMFLESLLKITYLIVALYVTLASFSLIGVHFGIFLATIILGNVLVRVAYEFALLLLVICRNTTEIAKSAKNKEEK